MKIIPFAKPTDREINEALKTLKNGGLIIFPTETCYGIGADATNQRAVDRLMAYKGGRENKPISVAVANRQMAAEYVVLNDTAKNLYQTLLPGPVTVVSKGKNKVVTGLESEMGTLGVRIPNYLPILELISKFGKPITATSANTSGKKPPYSLRDWQKYTNPTKQKIPELFLDAGQLPHHPPSTLVDTTLNELTVLRQGEIEIPTAAKRFESFSEQQTRNVGGEIMSTLYDYLCYKPIIIALQGELGAGKTQMAKGIARKLGINETVNSPTYTIMREYPYNVKVMKGILYHIDTWRLNEGQELLDLGLNEYLTPGNVIIIEWLQKIKTQLKAFRNQAVIVWVDIEQVNESVREIKWWKEDVEPWED